MALLFTSWLLSTLPWLYLTLLDSPTLYNSSTWLYLTPLHSTMTLLCCSWLTAALCNDCTSLYLRLLQFSVAVLAFTCLDYNLQWLVWYTTLQWLYIFGSTSIYYILPWLYLLTLHPTIPLVWCLHSTMPVLNGSSCYYVLYTVALLGSTWHYCCLPGSISLTLLHYTMALLGCTIFYHGSTPFYHGSVLHSTWLSYTLLWLYMALLDCTTFYCGSTLLYLTLLPSIPFL